MNTKTHFRFFKTQKSSYRIMVFKTIANIEMIHSDIQSGKRVLFLTFYLRMSQSPSLILECKYIVVNRNNTHGIAHRLVLNRIIQHGIKVKRISTFYQNQSLSIFYKHFQVITNESQTNYDKLIL